MKATRRRFLKTSLIAGAGMTMPGIAFAGNTAASPSSPEAQSAGTPEIPGTASFTRGIGMYPGAPDEDFSPTLAIDASAPYRNLALLRPAFASSSYDYNLTAQLITDGITDTDLPTWITTVVDGEILPKYEREQLVNHFPESGSFLTGSTPSVEIHLGGGTAVPQIDRIELFVGVPQGTTPGSLLFTVSASYDGHLWNKVGSGTGTTPLPPENYPPDLVRGQTLLAPSIAFDQARTARFYRVELGTNDNSSGTGEGRASGIHWFLGQVAFYHGQDRVQIGGPYTFTSAWKSAGLDEEWVYVDLGGSFSFDNVKLHWIARASEGKLQVSDDAQSWRDLQPLPSASDAVDEIHLTSPARGRYVRVLMTRPASANGYILSEMEVFGHGGFTVQPKPAPAPRADGRLDIAGGRWKLQRAGTEAATETGEALSAPGFGDDKWLVATVPGTVLTSYLNLGAIPDPNFGQNQLHISDSFFYSDFWYRTEFTPAAAKPGQVTILNLDGINWKADVYLNGAKLGHIDGGFMRGRFDVTGKLQPGKPNALAIRILKNATPGSCKQKTYESTGKNGGALGADNPTYHASIGWDWIPTVRGRNIGIWSDVYLTTTGGVTLEDPLVTSTFPQDMSSRPEADGRSGGTRSSTANAPSHADVSLEVFAVNHTSEPVSGTLRGRFGPIDFEQRVSLAASERQAVKLSPATHHQLRIERPELWWPAGYGEPHLYDVELRFEEKRGEVHDRKVFKAGIRQMTYNEDGGDLRIFINGRRLVAKGGSWGFGESMLRYRAREYDAAVRYHREMHFNMIRNWVGQIGDDAFYEACDRHGILVWQDFWLANPWDGPIPHDNTMFLANSRDYIVRIRSHASIGIYCGRNEWYPPAPLDKGLRALLAELHPDIHYIGSSADGPVSGRGPYHALLAPDYFRTADKKMHSEIGSPAIPPIESVRAMMPESAIWPQGLDWGLHDFTLQGAQGGTAFRTLVAETYGGATNGEDWIALAQFVNYEAYRAMFEAQSVHRMGVLLWMSHPCWPSFVWQTYDFYFEPTSAYFGSKKGCEPLHIQWNSYTETIEVVNYSGGNQNNLTAQVEILNMDGASMGKKTATVGSPEDSTSAAIKMEYPAGLTPVHFLRLTLLQNGTVLSTNFYMRGAEQGDLRAIRTLRKANVQATTTTDQRGGRWFLTTTLQNTSAWPALHVRTKAVRDTTGDRILPAIYDDNYIALMPNETRVIKTELNGADTRGEKPRIVVEGFNVASA